MNNLKELEKKYEELGKEIERLKKEQETVGFKNDPIFLLSEEEYIKYKDKIPKFSMSWWLRSPGEYSDRSALVYYDGSVGKFGDIVRFCSGGIRPALKISNFVGIKSFYPHKLGQRIVFNGVTWVKIDEGLYISELLIDFREFDSTSNDYETSEVRKFLLHWLMERMELN